MQRLTLAAAVALILAGVPLAADDKEQKKPATGKGQVAVFRLANVTESPTDEEFPLFGSGRSISFKDLVARMKKAGEDDSVKALVLFPEGGLGRAQIEEVRQVLAGVKKAGKDIYVHADELSTAEYALAAGATRISMVPTADLGLTGLYGESPYVRGLLDKLGVKPDFLTCGEYKSAAEIFMRDGPSPAADKMQNWLLDSLYESTLSLIAKGRGVEIDKAKHWVNNGPYTAEKAKAAGLIDAIEHRQDFTKMLKAKYGQTITFTRKYGEKKPLSLDLSSPFGLLKLWTELMSEPLKKKSDKAAVGIVYVEGPIMLGGGTASPFSALGGAAYSTAIRKALDEAAADTSVKAVVLRVNSPGGSAVASEIILDATRRVKAKKPFVVSMGDVAGSGGYYVACAADTIFADDSTITGSIGVVGGKLVTTPMWNKIGVTFKSYKRGDNAGLFTSDEVWSPKEKEKVQGWMDDIYAVFKGHVTAIRGDRLKKPIDELAGGRVYTGKQALELGLVDKIGSMQDAIQFIAAKAKLTDYDVRAVPEPKNFLEQLLEEASGGKDDPKNLELSKKLSLGGRQLSLVEMALPHLKHLDPQRLAAIRTALERLQLLQQEGAVLMMPEMIIRR